MYRNIVHGGVPPCPVCGAAGNMIDVPKAHSGKYRCLAAKCGASYNATWKTDAQADVMVRTGGGTLGNAK